MLFENRSQPPTSGPFCCCTSYKSLLSYWKALFTSVSEESIKNSHETNVRIVFIACHSGSLNTLLYHGHMFLTPMEKSQVWPFGTASLAQVFSNKLCVLALLGHGGLKLVRKSCGILATPTFLCPCHKRRYPVPSGKAGSHQVPLRSIVEMKSFKSPSSFPFSFYSLTTLLLT